MIIEDVTKMVKFYRVKHLPTGLYYKPGDNNLSKKGKIYTSTNHNCLTGVANVLMLHMEKTSNIVKKHPELFTEWQDSKINFNKIIRFENITKFEIEYM